MFQLFFSNILLTEKQLKHMSVTLTLNLIAHSQNMNNYIMSLASSMIAVSKWWLTIRFQVEFSSQSTITHNKMKLMLIHRINGLFM